jgi:hypothetical protein
MLDSSRERKDATLEELHDSLVDDAFEEVDEKLYDIHTKVGSATTLVTFICVLCTLHSAHVNFTPINMQLYTPQPTFVERYFAEPYHVKIAEREISLSFVACVAGVYFAQGISRMYFLAVNYLMMDHVGSASALVTFIWVL